MKAALDGAGALSPEASGGGFDSRRLHIAARDVARPRFFHAKERDATNPPHLELAWIPLATEGVAAHVVLGNHVTMLAEPHVRSLAKKLRGAFKE